MLKISAVKVYLFHHTKLISLELEEKKNVKRRNEQHAFVLDTKIMPLIKPPEKTRVTALKIINEMENGKAFLDSIKCTTWTSPFFLFLPSRWLMKLPVCHTHTHSNTPSEIEIARSCLLAVNLLMLPFYPRTRFSASLFISVIGGDFSLSLVFLLLK